MDFIVCAFYTRDTFYEEEAAGLIETLESLELPHDICPYASRGSWVANASIKPEFIRAMLHKHTGKHILYVDVDARFRRYPELYEDFGGDIGVHYLRRRRKRELLSGTIFLKNNARVRSLVRLWVENQRASPGTWDQRVLERVLRDHAERLGVRVVETPPQYTQIYDTMRDCGPPVIEHMQASRRARSRGLSRRGLPGYRILYAFRSAVRKIRGLASRVMRAFRGPKP